MSALFQRKPKDKEKTSVSPAGAAKTSTKKQAEARQDRITYRVLVQPHVTEKAGVLQGMNQYVFRVDARAGKREIAQAIKERYGVMPKRVNTVRIAGKKRRLGRTEGWVGGYKKAVITLPEGSSIDVVAQ